MFGFGLHRYQTSEHAFQAAKAANVGDHDRVWNQPTPAAAKYTGRSIPLRADWEEVKESVMRKVLEKKFADPLLKERLVATAPAQLIEGNTWCDNVWGDCFLACCENVPGRNLLGKFSWTDVLRL